MNPRDLPIALLIVAALLWGLAISGPGVVTQLGSRAEPQGEVEFVAALQNDERLWRAVGDEAEIGYASDVAIDTRVGGPSQGIYYLSQFALAPLLLDLDSPEQPEHALVLMHFSQPERAGEFLDARGLRSVIALNSGLVVVRARKP